MTEHSSIHVPLGYPAERSERGRGLGPAPWYDTREGIEVHLREGLAGLHLIAAARHMAGYERGERMAEWCVLGR